MIKIILLIGGEPALSGSGTVTWLRNRKYLKYHR